MCSSTRGPAIAPSLVTWPTSTSAKPRALASRINSKLRGAHLANRAGRALDRVEPHGLDAVDHHEAEVALRLERRGDVAHVDRRGEFERRVRKPEPPGAQPHLVDRFLARDVHDPAPGPRQRRGGLQHQRRLADPRIPADQHRRGWHKPAAQHAIEFGDAGDRPRWRLGRALQADKRHPLARAPAGAGPDLLGFLGQRVPLAARLAPPDPFRVGRAAILADVARRGLSHAASAIAKEEGGEEVCGLRQVIDRDRIVEPRYAPARLSLWRNRNSVAREIVVSVREPPAAAGSHSLS